MQLEKAEEPPPFQTRAEIERAIAGLPLGREDDLWDSLYLTAGEIAGLLGYVQEHATQPWLYPMVCLAAHTGMRRSEMIRALRSDVDLEGSTILVRERKRKQGQKTTRRVPLTPFLVDILTDWLCDHPGGHALFCQQPEVARSKKRSRTTGYKGDTTRATTVAGRPAVENLPDAELERLDEKAIRRPGAAARGPATPIRERPPKREPPRIRPHRSPG